MKPYDFKWTRFYEDATGFITQYPGLAIELNENEASSAQQ